MTINGQTKKQFYNYTLRSAAASNYFSCTDKMLAYILPPANALSIESLNCHFKMTFDVTVPVGDRILSKIGIASEASVNPTYLRTLTIDQAADVNRVVELNIDLTSLLKKDNVALDADIIGDFTQNNMTMVYVEFPVALNANPDTGIIDLWKIDALFTTTEIR